MSTDKPLHAVFRQHPEWLEDETPRPDLMAMMREAARQRVEFEASVKKMLERKAREEQGRKYAERGITPLREWDE